MKHFRILLPLLILALVLSACGSIITEAYTYTQGGKTITVDPANGTITHGEDVYSYTMEKRGNHVSFVIDYPNGGIFHWTTNGTGGAGGGNEAYNEIDYLSGSFLVNALEENMPREKIGSVFIGIFLMALGGANFFWPELSFDLRYGWAVKDAEPSDAYIIWAKIGGVLVAVLGLVLCLI